MKETGEVKRMRYDKLLATVLVLVPLLAASCVFKSERSVRTGEPAIDHEHHVVIDED